MSATNEPSVANPTAQPRRRPWLWRLGVYGPLAAVLVGLVLHPYPRQSIFGPKIEGEPVWYWQQLYRQRHARGEETAFGFVRQLLGLAAPGDSGRSVPVSDPAMAPVLAGLLRDSNEHVRAAALRDLGRHERRAALREDLIPLLDDPSPDTRGVAALYLADLESTRDLRVLERLLDDPSPECRMRVAIAVHRLNPQSERVLSAVRSGLKEPSRVAQLHAAGAARMMPSFGDRLYPDLQAYVLEDPSNRGDGILAMSAFGPRALPDLLRCLESPHVNTRQAAAVAVYHMKPPPPEAEPILLRLLDDMNSDVRLAARSALHRIDPERHPQPPRVAD